MTNTRQENETGIFKMPDVDYFASSGVSNSSLNNMSKSEAHYKHNLTNPMESTPAMVFGSLFHCEVLETAEVEDRYIVAPKIDKRTKVGKAEYAQFSIEAEGKIIVSADDMVKSKEMHQSLLNHPVACDLIGRSGENEQAIFSEDKDTGILKRGKLDRICQNTNMIIDLKSSADASPQGFQKSVFNYNYHCQSAYYLDLATEQGLDIEKMIFVVVEKTAPFNVAVYELCPYSLEIGRRTYKDNLNKLANCEMSDTWAGYSSEIETIETPNWLR